MKNKKVPIYPKMATEFIKELLVIIEKHGDMPIAAFDSETGYTTSNIRPEVIPWYYDGGYVMPVDVAKDAHGHQYAHMHYISSKQSDDKGRSIPHSALDKKHLSFIRVRYSVPIDLSSTLDGKPFKQRWIEDGNEPFWKESKDVHTDVEDIPIRRASHGGLRSGNEIDRLLVSLRSISRFIRYSGRTALESIRNYTKKDRK